MAKHRIEARLPTVDVGSSPLSIAVRSDGRKLGEIAISRGGLRWRRNGAKVGKLIAWEKMAKILDVAAGNARPSVKDDEAHTGLCPRCMWHYLVEGPEDVEGAGYAYTHQCPACGMGVHHELWPSQNLETFKDLLNRLGVEDLEALEGGVSDFTDDNVRIQVEDKEPDQITSYAMTGPLGQVFEFPGNMQELMFDLQSAEDNSRQDWRFYSCEAARRLVPLSEVYGFPDPQNDAMPDDWVVDSDGNWSPGKS